MPATVSLSALRPGAALGAYPEKTPRDPAWPDWLARRLMRLWQPLKKNLRPSELQAFVRLVDTQAVSMEISPQTYAGLAAELRQRFAREGLTDQLVARSFALVRAVAEDKLGLRHYDVQLMAGRVMMEGALAEMETGEGKTLVATLPACTAALAGIPVHVVTANDYLVTRDATTMGPVYRALGLTVGAITESSTPTMRRDTYARDIAYNTSKQLAFDYLRDRIAMGRKRGSVHLRLERLYSEQAAIERVMMRGLCFAIVDEADSVLIDEARTPFIIASESETAELEKQCQAALDLARSLDSPTDFLLDVRARKAELSEQGRKTVREKDCDVLPGNSRVRIALIEQAIAAMLLFVRDRDYLVREDRIQIIDPQTGRVMADRSWNRGLHQMIELKEGCPITAPRNTLASLTFQRFFRRYLRLSGMTGTAYEVRDEFWSTYGMPFVRLPTHRPSQRQKLTARVCTDSDSKWQAIVERVAEVRGTGRPVLIGTRSVGDSERLSALLDRYGLRHNLLNARQDAEEARIVAAAGQMGQVTVATNMAGRGTDIELGEGVAELGGLHVIAAEKNDERRLDRQLSGRAGRHGEPGSCEVFHCLDDEVIRRHWPVRLHWLLNIQFGTKWNRIMLSIAIAIAQKRCEHHHRNARRDLAIMQDQTDRLLSFSGQSE